MKFREIGINADPAHVRRLMHISYESYVSGSSNFPNLRFPDPVETFPRKTQGIAGALFAAWQVIDADNHTFEDSMEQMIKAGIGLGKDPSSGAGLVITKIGRNMGRVGLIAPGERPSIHLETTRLESLRARLEGTTFRLADGVEIDFQEGSFHSSDTPNMVIPRVGNVQVVYVGDRDLPELAPSV